MAALPLGAEIRDAQPPRSSSTEPVSSLVPLCLLQPLTELELPADSEVRSDHAILARYPISQ